MTSRAFLRTLEMLRLEMLRCLGPGYFEDPLALGLTDLFVIQGSGSLALRGFAIRPGDVDVFVRPELWAALEARSVLEKRWVHLEDPPVLLARAGAWIGGETLEVMLWERWDDRHELALDDGAELVRQAFASRELFMTRGSENVWPVVGLDLLVAWKEHVLRLDPEKVEREGLTAEQWRRVREKHAAHLRLIRGDPFGAFP